MDKIKIEVLTSDELPRNKKSIWEKVMEQRIKKLDKEIDILRNKLFNTIDLSYDEYGNAVFTPLDQGIFNKKMKENFIF